MTGDGREERLVSARQRVVVLTFDTIEEADAWDRAGQPIALGTTDGAEHAPG